MAGPGITFDTFWKAADSARQPFKDAATIDDLGKIVAELETAKRWIETGDQNLAKLAIDRARRTALALARSVAG